MEKNSPCIILGVTGSIAAYKAAELVRLLVKAGCEVHAIMTRSACQFITPLTMQTLARNRVTLDAFDEVAEWNPQHISLADRADIALVAPSTANTLAKLAHGLADDALTATLLATKAPLIVAPAMNSGMWTHPATIANMHTLAERGVHCVAPRTGELACGSEGIGCLADLPVIIEKVFSVLAEK